MKLHTIISVLASAVVSLSSIPWAAAETPALEHKLTITPEIKKAFEGSDSIEVRAITGTTSKFEVGGTYRVIGVCRQDTFKTALLYIGNTAEAGPDAIVATGGSSLSKPCPNGLTEFDVTFTLLRPGILHATIYDTNRVSRGDNAYAGIYLGDVVFKH